MDVALQVKLLRVLQEGVVQPLGSNRFIPVDVRVISSTNVDLQEAMRSGAFREDLYYRLNVLEIELPSLAQRREDVPVLAAAFLREFGVELGKSDLHLTSGAAEFLSTCEWRGNVRELRNVMERAAVLAETPEVSESVARSLVSNTPQNASEPAEDSSNFELAAAVAEVERKAILRALAATDDNKVEAATLLGIGERTLWSKLKKHGL
jgi:DNA-binding NtrC family response regulator